MISHDQKKKAFLDIMMNESLSRSGRLRKLNHALDIHKNPYGAYMGAYLEYMATRHPLMHVPFYIIAKPIHLLCKYVL